MKKYVPPCTEEEFQAALAAVNLDIASTELTQALHDLEYGACEAFDERSETMLENAVAMGLMTKRVIANYPHAIYHTVDKAKAA